MGHTVALKLEIIFLQSERSFERVEACPKDGYLGLKRRFRRAYKRRSCDEGELIAGHSSTLVSMSVCV